MSRLDPGQLLLLPLRLPPPQKPVLKNAAPLLDAIATPIPTPALPSAPLRGRLIEDERDSHRLKGSTVELLNLVDELDANAGLGEQQLAYAGGEPLSPDIDLQGRANTGVRRPPRRVEARERRGVELWPGRAGGAEAEARRVARVVQDDPCLERRAGGECEDDARV